MKISFIINPVAGKNRKRDISPIIKNYMKNKKYDYKILKTEYKKHAEELTKEYIDLGYNIVVAVGGDGTVREVATGIIYKKKGILGIIPMGTGNDLARSLQIPLRIEEAIQKIINKNLKEIDIGKAGKSIFLNVASIGFDAEIVRNTKKYKKYLKGKLAYTFGLLKTLFKYKPKKIKIKHNGIEREEKVLLIASANGKFYGGGMKICPKADIMDEELDVCLIKNISMVKLFFLFPSVYNGKHGKFKKYVEFFRVSNLEIYSENDICLNIDGDIINSKGRIYFGLTSNKLKIIT